MLNSEEKVFKGIKPKSGITGLGYCPRKRRWIVRLTFNRKALQLGYYMRKEDAIKYLDMALRLRESMTYTYSAAEFKRQYLLLTKPRKIYKEGLLPRGVEAITQTKEQG